MFYVIDFFFGMGEVVSVAMGIFEIVREKMS